MQAAVRVDFYSLAHKTAFGRTFLQLLNQFENMPGEEGFSSNVHDSSPSAARDLMSNTNVNSSCLPTGPTCF